jgi:hypothetical protein
MTDYTKRMLSNCQKQLQIANAERNPTLIAYWTARIEVLERDAA